MVMPIDRKVSNASSYEAQRDDRTAAVGSIRLGQHGSSSTLSTARPNRKSRTSCDSLRSTTALADQRHRSSCGDGTEQQHAEREPFSALPRFFRASFPTARVTRRHRCLRRHVQRQVGMSFAQNDWQSHATDLAACLIGNGGQPPFATWNETVPWAALSFPRRTKAPG